MTMRTRVTAGEVREELEAVKKDLANVLYHYHKQILQPYVMKVVAVTRPYQPLWKRVWDWFVMWKAKRAMDRKMKTINLGEANDAQAEG